MFEGPSKERTVANNQKFEQGKEASIIIEGGDEVAGTVTFLDSQEDGAFIQMMLATSEGERMFVYVDGVWAEAVAQESEEEEDGEIDFREAA